MGTFGFDGFNGNCFNAGEGSVPVRGSNMGSNQGYNGGNANMLNQFSNSYQSPSKRYYRKPSRPVNLPSGTFRSSSYKTILLSHNGRTRKFNFEFEYGYWDDPNYGSCDYETYRIWILSFPFKPNFDQSASHEAHMFFDDDYHNFYICWDEPITSFDNANAVAFVWAKNFLRNCASDYDNHKYVSLPSGTFRSKANKHFKNKRKKSINFLKNWYHSNDDINDYFASSYEDAIPFINKPKTAQPIQMTQEVYSQIKSNIGCYKVERGGMLGTSDGNIIDTFVFDKYADTSYAAYSPNTEYLNKVLKDWQDKGIDFAGFVHSHPSFCTSPSGADYDYASRIMDAFGIDKIAMPIVMSEKEVGKFKIYPYIMENNQFDEVNCIDTGLDIVNNKEVMQDMVTNTDNDILCVSDSDFDSDLIKRFEKKFEMQQENLKNRFKITDPIEAEKPTENRQDELHDTIFDRIENAVDTDLLSKSLVIGVGCGGSREFYIDMARMGVGNFLILDGDRVSTSNISSQNVYSDEHNQFKVNCVASKIHLINPQANVRAIPEFLTDKLQDGWFESMLDLFEGVDNILLCGFTDSFDAQARCARLAMKYKLMYLSGQHYYQGLASEAIYYHPEISKTSVRSLLKNRYEDYLKNCFKNDVTSKGSPIFNTVRLNAICEKIAIGLLMNKSDKNRLYSDFLTRKPEKNLVIIRQHSLTGSPLQDIEDLFNRYSSSPLFDDVIWLGAREMGIKKDVNKDTKDYKRKKYGKGPDTREIKNKEAI